MICSENDGPYPKSLSDDHIPNNSETNIGSICEALCLRASGRSLLETTLVVISLILFSTCSVLAPVEAKGRPVIAGTLIDNYLIVDLYGDGGFRARNVEGRWITFPGDTSMLSVRIGRSEYVLYPNLSTGVELDSFFIPSENQTEVSWWIDGVRVGQRLNLISGTIYIMFEITSFRKESTDISLRFLLDFQLGENDGAPIYVENHGFITNEVAFTFPRNVSLEKWWVCDSLETRSTVICRLTTPCSKLIFAYWGTAKNSIFDYNPISARSFYQPESPKYPESDGCALIYYPFVAMKPNTTKTVTLTYGIF